MTKRIAGDAAEDWELPAREKIRGLAGDRRPLRPDDRQWKEVPVVAREPLYGVAEWAACFPPDLLDLWDEEVALLHDDRLGRCLDRLFASAGPEMILAVVRHVVGEFEVGLDELHNDSTTVSFYGAYEEAGKAGCQQGRPTPAITWGHSKDHRPDLKQLLYTLTISEDGGVPVYWITSRNRCT